MTRSRSANFQEQNYYKVILFVGVVLSETQILVNVKDYTPIFTIPYFTTAYFVTTTIHLTFVFIAYAFLSRREKGTVLESYEHIVLPISVLLISLLGKNDGFVEWKAVSVMLFGVQGMLITAKIIYFNSVTCQLAQISTINKLIRVFKLNIIATLPLFISELLVSVIVVTICQALSLSAFFLKFTYQKCIYEYILLIGVFCGIISAVQHVFQTILNLPYLFIGEICSLFFYFKTDNYLIRALEIKYTNSLSNNSQSKQDDQILAGLLFVNQCLFQKQRTIHLSQSAKNEGIIHAYNILERLKVGPAIRNEDRDIHHQLDLVFQIQDEESIRLVSKQLFDAYCARFHQTSSFSCFEFTVSKALQIGGSFTNKALILYYGYIQRKKQKTSIFESCKFQYLYNKILKQIQEKQNDKEDINFIEFSDNLKMLNVELEQCLSNELKLMEYLSDKNKKADMFTDERLFARSALKHKIRQRIEICINQQIYFSSNQFKFLYLLYHVSVEKRFESLKEKLKKHFLASEVQRLKYESCENSLIVLSGFNHGQIINSNEIFKSYFGIALSSFSRNNISQFIPTEKQKICHSTLMSDFVQLKIEKNICHNDYECFLSLQREYGSVKLKVVQSFIISVRIYYENKEGFHYICCLNKIEKMNNGKDSLTLFKRDCENFNNKGVDFTFLCHRNVQQLGEIIELSDIEFNLEIQAGLRISSNIGGRVQIRKERPKTQRFLQQKIQKIQRKMLEQGEKNFRLTFLNILQICAVLSFSSLIFVIMVNLSHSIDKLSLSIQNLIIPVNGALLTYNRVLLQQEILSLQAETKYFPDNICLVSGISSIRGYVSNILYKDLENNTDKFIGTLYSLHNYQSLNQNIYVKQFSSLPYLMHPEILISFHKNIQLMKSQTYTWMSQLNNSKFNSWFYSRLFPSILLNSTTDSPDALTTLVANSQDIYITNILTSVNNYQALIVVLVIFLGVVIMALRVSDNRAPIRYLKIVECIKTEKLNERIKELKSAINQIHQIRGNRIESIEFDRTFLVQIKIDKKETENIPLQEFTDWHIRNKAQYEMEESDVSFYDEQKQFIKRNGKKSLDNRIMQSQLLRLVYYKRWYLLIMVGIIAAIIILTNSTLMMEMNRIMTLSLSNDASEQFNKIQQKMINVIAYSWLKVFSLHESFNMTAAKLMFNEAIKSLLASNYQAKISAAYSKDISDRLLFGSVCDFFNNQTTCQSYRNNIFSSGFSMLIPFVLKESMQIDQISSNPAYYTLNLCDKTWLLFEGIIPMTTRIAEYGFKQMNAKANQGFTSKFIEISVMIAIAIVMTIIFQRRRYKREKIIREEVFSLETVENLYAVVQFKPYFNKIYYS